MASDPPRVGPLGVAWERSYGAARRLGNWQCVVEPVEREDYTVCPWSPRAAELELLAARDALQGFGDLTVHNPSLPVMADAMEEAGHPAGAVREALARAALALAALARAGD